MLINDTGMKKVGELIALNKPLKEVLAPSHALTKLLDAATAIRNDPDQVEAAFMARQLVQCTLPHANPGNIPLWKRSNGNLVLGIQQGYDLKSGQALGYPYGSIPRLLLFWITTEVLRVGQRRLELGRSLHAFMKKLGLDPSSRGKRSDAVRLKDQMRRLFGAHISFDQTVSDGTTIGQRWLHMPVAPKGELWWDPKQPNQDDLWGSWIELGEEFYRAITQAPIPVDMRALQALRRSPLALDLYAWCCYRTFAVARSGKPHFVSWAALMEQLGTDYTDRKDFKRHATGALKKIQAVYPGLNLEFKPGGVQINPGRLAIPARPAKRTDE